MPTSDPISDFLTRVRNAILARHGSVSVPTSNTVKAIAGILHEEGYVTELVEDIGEAPQSSLVLTLRYCADKTNAISGLRRVSRPGQRKYVQVSEIPKVKNGLGIAILSTSSGVMTGSKARKMNVGGELLCTIW
ncbi:MAG: 30S ribosomal protein S8 [Myxococcales bacterium]|nr:30S ribosomal protein S8 [Myxococcales bacterium]